MTAEQTEFALTRTFEAPREKVWQAWTEPQRLAQWWGPKGSTLEVVKLELRVDGVFHYCMSSSERGTMWGRFQYREIVAPERLSYISSFADESGNTIRAPFSAKFPLQILNTLTLSEQNGHTTLDLRGRPIDASNEEREFFASMHASMQQGLGGTLDQLAAYLASA